ncbi:Carotene epsilon-monooxygenase, chloroplastic-like protein [Drosera capensis]
MKLTASSIVSLMINIRGRLRRPAPTLGFDGGGDGIGVDGSRRRPPPRGILRPVPPIPSSSQLLSSSAAMLISLPTTATLSPHRHRHLTPLSSLPSAPPPPPPSPPPPPKPTSWLSPTWLSSLTTLTRPLTPSSSSPIPIAQPLLDDVTDLLGGALFLPLFKWMKTYGHIYRLSAGLRDFVVVSDPEIAKHVLRGYGTRYGKGLVREVSEFLFGEGFAIAEGMLWTARRRAVVPSLHKKYLSVIVDRVFCKCAKRMVDKLKLSAASGTAVNMEELFSQLTLDIIGLSVFNYNFDALTTDSPVIDAVYTALKEAEARSTDLLPYWKIQVLCKIIPRQVKAERAVTLIRETVEELIMKCKVMVEAEGEMLDNEEYVNEADPSILRFLLASREEVSSVQLRDDLLSMLVAGHETTGSVLTWTVYLLSKDSRSLAKAQEEVDRVLQGRPPSYEDTKELKFLMRCILESMRLYPHPPVLLRRAHVVDVLPGDYKVDSGQDIMISVYNIHHSPQVWERAEEFLPERFIPFSGGPRKCVGDQFALLEAVVALAILLQHMNFELVPDQKINMTTGATIHTTNGLYMKLSSRERVPAVALHSFVAWMSIEAVLVSDFGSPSGSRGLTGFDQ